MAISLVGGLAFLVALTSGPDAGAVPTADEVAARMMSPFCPGLTVEECPSDQSGQLRNEISDLIDEGATNADIDRWILDNFGESALARPTGAAVWLVPPAAGLAGLAAVMVLVRRRSGPAEDNRHDPEPTAADEERFEEEFREFRRSSE